MQAATTFSLVVTVFLALLAPFATGIAHAETGTEPASFADGTYLVEVTLEGGSGRASVQSPTEIVIDKGQATATITWSSPNYDYMLVEDDKYLPTNTQGNSSFQIPVSALDEPLPVIGDTTAMSQPHEVSYTLTFHSSTLVRQEKDGLSPVTVSLALAAVALIAMAVVWWRKRAARPEP